MIDYGEDKQTYGAPKIVVGPVSQALTALYIGVFLLAFFVPEFAKNYLPQVNADLPQKFWTLLTGIFIFPESAGVYTQIPAGFWVIVTFFLIFLVVRPLEEKKSSYFSFAAFLIVFMLGSALTVWALAPGFPDPAATWPFWFSGASGWALWKFRTLNVKFGERRFPCKWLYLVLLLIPVIFSLVKHHDWKRTAIYLACALAGILWGVIEARIHGNTFSGEKSEDIK